MHTPLFAKGETSAFLTSIVNAGLPAGIALAAARIAGPDFLARAEYASRSDLSHPAPPLGDPRLVELARWLARADNRRLMAEVVRGELRPDLVSLIAGTCGAEPPAAGTIVQDDLLSLYLVPGALADYRRTLGALYVLARLRKESGKGLHELLLPSPAAITDDLHGPWPDNRIPLPWEKLARGRILLPAQIAVRPAPGPGPGGYHRFNEVFEGSSLSAADFRQFTDLASAPADPGGGATGATEAAKPDVKSKAPRN